ncbi:aldose 1-epimerase family protein [Nonomuraea sp. NPDC050547]|uniref:aldose 1-epimerase family protein n=1 Tax=unclassified Nonomuraea TaxID=2593643 RepID=UPI0037A4AAD3
MHSAVSGGQFTLSAGGYTAVVTESGAGLRVLRLDGQDLVLTYGPQQVAPAAFGQLLIPWPNRIERGRYSWEGRELQLDISEPRFDCAIHGLVRWLPWNLESQTPEAVALTCRLLGSPGYPFRLALRAEYALDAGSGLTIRVTALNDGETAAPYAHGAHPYLTVGEPIDGCAVQAPGRRHLPVDAMMIPRGPAEPVDGTPFDLRTPRTLGDLRIDRAFTDLERDADGRAWVHLTGTTRTTSLWTDRAHPWLELYTADSVPGPERRRGLGAEPMTCPPNGFASRTDLVVLQPGDLFTGTWGITAAA